jgi:hypothetical protein
VGGKGGGEGRPTLRQREFVTAQRVLCLFHTTNGSRKPKTLVHMG